MEPEHQMQQEDSEEEETQEEREYRLEREREDQIWYAMWEKYNSACAVDDIATIEEMYQEEMYQTGQLGPENLNTMMVNSIHKGSLAVTRFIITKLGADPNEIPLSSIRECRSLDMFKLLADHGLDFKSKGNDVLEYMVDDRNVLDWFLDQEVDINGNWSRSDRTCGVLNEAAVRGDIEMFDYLVSRGAEPSRSLALHKATGCKDAVKTTSMIIHLIEKYRFDVNADDRSHPLLDKGFAAHLNDGPPLNWAIAWGNIPAVQFLLKHKADPSIGRSILVAFQKVYNPGRSGKSEDLTPILKLLLEAGGDASYGLKESVYYKDLAAAKLCLEYGADPIAAEEGDAERVALSTGDYSGMSIEMRELINKWK